ncbi:hypothetical protein [Hymenobacter crusticola]|uniref:Uncharacterized protein n=1 Tax=Hymenobacter crusticola TaxID=1770526 RepID=A0A243WBH6_9BACT|nr:hypothetical protein [Hymenobacter crusticola]OUJ72932.1 hypothetical protein BXP70_16675 [Hymenobacter crusticola]
MTTVIRARLLTSLLGVLLLVATACWARSIHSDLFIEPGKQFVLGGGQRGSFKVAAHNKGSEAVVVKERPKGGGIFGKATLAPGQHATLSFGAGSSAVLLNPTVQQAHLDLRITGDTKLRMDYEPTASR